MSVARQQVLQRALRVLKSRGVQDLRGCAHGLRVWNSKLRKEPCLTVFVKEKRDMGELPWRQRLGSKLKVGRKFYPLDILPVGEIHFEALPLGEELAVEGASGTTTGYFHDAQNRLIGLSCAHVLWGGHQQQQPMPGSDVYSEQPAGGRARLGSTTDMGENLPGSDPGGANLGYTDCASFAVAVNMLDAVMLTKRLGILTGTDVQLYALQTATVIGVGAISGQVTGTIHAVGGSIDGDFAPSVDFIIYGHSLTREGDSGMLWRLKDDFLGWKANTAVGIHMGGNSTETQPATVAVGMFIKRAMDLVGATELYSV